MENFTPNWNLLADARKHWHRYERRMDGWVDSGAWLSLNLKTVLDGHLTALAEVDRLRSALADTRTPANDDHINDLLGGK